jgi:hypothetical protein
MAKLKEISEYKNTVIEKLLETDEIVKALYYENENYLEQPTLDDPSILVYENIFPYRFIPDTNTERKTFLTVSCRKIKKVNNAFKAGFLTLAVFTHKELFKTNYGETRVDKVMSLIDEIFNSSRGIGIGKLEFVEMDELIVNDKYMGAYISYKPIDFN